MDNLALLSLLALSPILTIGVLLVGLRWPAKRAMPVGFVVVLLVAFFVWEMTPLAIAASSVQGLILALTLLYIVFGALLLLETLMQYHQPRSRTSSAPRSAASTSATP